MDLTSLKVTELKAELRARGLPVSGPKAELIDRLGTFIAQQESANNTASTINTTVDSIESEKVTEKPEEVDDLDDLLDVDDEPSTEVKVTSDVKPNVSQDEASNMTENDRKQARADRFKTGNSENNNISTSEDVAAKKSRAERFGTVESAAAKDIEKDKKKSRADRFGTGVAVEVKEDNSVDSEAKKRRAERFGIVEDSVSPKKLAKITSAPIDVEKLKSRAERFGVVSLEDKSKKAARAARFNI